MKADLFKMGFRHRLTGIIPPDELNFAVRHSLYDYLRGWHYERALFPD